MKKWLLPAAGIALLVALDQVVKRWVLVVLVPHGPIPVISVILELLYVENRGAAFGILQNRQWFFMIITAVVLLGLLWIYPRIPDDRHYLPLRLCLIFIASGAIGNMIDRITRGYVVDFIYFKLIDFPVFNLADIYVTCSAFALVYLLIFYYKDQELECIFRKK